MKITVMVEGNTEKVFIPFLREYLKKKLEGKMPKIGTFIYNGRLPKRDILYKHVVYLLKSGSDHVIARTDVYTNCNASMAHDFVDANDAKAKMREWVGPEPRFHPHAAQYEFEAWLLPYWQTIQKLANHQKSAPAGNPETINHNSPPSKHIEEIFNIGKSARSYVKTRDASRILRDNDLSIAISQCAELKAFVNTILFLCGETTIQPN